MFLCYWELAKRGEVDLDAMRAARRCSGKWDSANPARVLSMSHKEIFSMMTPSWAFRNVGHEVGRYGTGGNCPQRLLIHSLGFR
jgi:hypothetical protein